MSTVEIETGRRIRAARESKNRTQVALAEAIGTSPNRINVTENIGINMTIERLCQIAVALGVEPAELLPTLNELRELAGISAVETLEDGKPPLRGAEYLDAVIDGARKYVDRHGARPRTDGGDASSYVGFETTWSAINFALAKGSHGVDPCGGIHDLLDKHRVGRRRRRA